MPGELSGEFKKTEGPAQKVIDKMMQEATTGAPPSVKIGVLGGKRYPVKPRKTKKETKEGSKATEGEKAAAPSEGPYVARLARKHEFGYPEGNEPPRPTFRVAMVSNLKKYRTILKKGNEAIAEGDTMRQRDILAKLGEVAAADIKVEIARLSEPKLLPATVKARARERSSTGGEVSETLEKPLIDHGLEINSISYEVSEG